MRIAFIGTHGTGKTSLVQAIADFMGLQMITERARLVAREWGYTPATIPSERLMEYQREVITRQVGAEKALHPVGFVSDRSVIDNLAYAEALVAADSTRAFNDLYWHWSLADERIGAYDLLIYIPVMFSLEDDGERHVDPAFQQDIDRRILRFVKSHGIGPKVYQIRSEGVENRIAELKQMLEPWRR